MDSKERQYVKGGARKYQYGINLDLNLTQIMNEVPRHTAKNGDEYIKLTLGEKREQDQFGNDYYISVNDFVPDKSKAGKSKKKAAQPKDEEETDDMPF